MRPEKYITTLVAPGALSENTMEVLKHYYGDLGIVPILSDGLNVYRDEEDINTFYVSAPGSVKLDLAIEFTDKIRDSLIKSGIKNPKVICLPDGIRPKAI